MKPIEAEPKARYEGVRLFADDLKYLVELARSQKYKEMEISYGQFSYESLEELTRNNPVMLTKDLKITFVKWTKNSRDSASFTAHKSIFPYVYLFGSNDGVAGKMRQFVESKVPWYFRFLSGWLMLSAFSLLLILAQNDKGSISTIHQFLEHFALGVMAYLGCGFVARYFLFGVFLRQRHEAGVVMKVTRMIFPYIVGGIIAEGFHRYFVK